MPEASFCGVCGAAISQHPYNTNNDAASVLRLIQAIELTLRDAEINDQLQAYSAALEVVSPPAEMALAWSFRMRCYARLGYFAEAQQALLKARECYGRHLGLEGESLTKYVADVYSLDENAGLKEIRENPCYMLVGDSLSLHVLPHNMEGNSDEDRTRAAMNLWADFATMDSERLTLQSILGVLYLKSKQYSRAASIFESVVRSSRHWEINGIFSFHLLWPNVLLGDCYKALGRLGNSIQSWQFARSLEYWQEDNDVVFDRYASYWIQQAKDRLLQAGIALPTGESSERAASHLSAAWQWMLKAEAEAEDLDIFQLANKLKYDGEGFQRCTLGADSELQMVERYDPFAIASVLTPDGETEVWVRYDLVKSTVMDNWGLLHLAHDKINEAIVAFQASLGVSTSLHTYLHLAIAYECKGDIKKSVEICRFCIDHAAEVASIVEDEEKQQLLVEIITQVLLAH